MHAAGRQGNSTVGRATKISRRAPGCDSSTCGRTAKRLGAGAEVLLVAPSARHRLRPGGDGITEDDQEAEGDDNEGRDAPERHGRELAAQMHF